MNRSAGDERCRALGFLVLSSLLLAACAAKRSPALEERGAPRGRVSVAEEHRSGSVTSATSMAPWSRQLFRPLASETILPSYPPEALAEHAPPIRVRVDFIVDRDGRPTEVRSMVLDETSHAERFVEACERALRRWRFSPAWRLADDPEENTDGLVLGDYPSRIVFRFDVDAGTGQSTLEESIGDEPRKVE